MLLASINPFIRFAKPITFEHIVSATVSYDSRFFYVRNGECTLNISGKEHKLQTGSLLIWQSGTPYIFSVKNNIGLVAVNFDYTQKNSQKKESISTVPLSDFAEENLLEKICFSDFEILNSPIVLHNMQHMESKIDLITDEFAKKKLGHDSICSAVLKEIITEAARIALVNIPENSWKIENVIRYIEQNYNRDVSNAELAKIAGYHSYHLNRLIKSTTGMTLHQYMLNVRIEKAKDKLLNTSLSIFEIAELCGFKNSYHFSSTFKSKTGLTPSLFRNAKKRIL